MKHWIMLGLGLAVGLSASARADEKEDQVFAAGQFTGATTFCGVPREQVNAVAKAMLDAFGVDSSGPNPLMTKFTQGVTVGTQEQRDAPQASCDEVKEGFEQMKARLQ